MSTNDHVIKIDDDKKGLRLIVNEGRPLYSVIEDVPNYQQQLRIIQRDWTGGHGQYDLVQPDMYFEGQSIDTTQEGRLLLGPEIQQVGVSGGDLGANPVCFYWFGAISKLMVATATKVFWYDGTNFVEKKAFTAGTISNLSEVNGILYVSLSSPQRYEYCVATSLGGATFGGTAWDTQTFTPATSHTIVSVKLFLLRTGSPGTITVSIRATDGAGKPTGADLCSGTTDGDTLDTSTPEWREVTLGSGTALTASTKYAIVARATSGDASNYVHWRIDSSPSYTGGNHADSADSGSSWTATSYDALFEEWGGGDGYYYSADGIKYVQTDLSDSLADQIFGAPNPAATATVLWKSKNPNEVAMTTDGRTAADGGVAYDSANYIGDTSNNITNIFLVNDNLMIGKEDRLWHLDSDGGTHPLMNDLAHNRSTTNFQHVTEYQTSVYFTLVTGLGEISSYNSYSPVGPLLDAADIGKVGTPVGLASETNYIYAAFDEGTNTHIYKGVLADRRDGWRWEWCPWVSLGTNTCATMAVCQHSSTDRRLWFGYGDYAAYVILTDNPTADSSAKFAAEGWLRGSYIYGTNPYWDKMFQSIVTETKSCDANKTVTIKYRKDTDTDATVCTPPIKKNGVIYTNLSNQLDCKRIQFEIHLATNADTTTPEVLYFEARGVENPEVVRIHEATYSIGTSKSRHSKTMRDFFRNARTSKKLIKFADLRYGESIDKDYHWIIMQPGFPREPELYKEKGRQPELGVQCRWQEISFTE